MLFNLYADLGVRSCRHLMHMAAYIFIEKSPLTTYIFFLYSHLLRSSFHVVGIKLTPCFRIFLSIFLKLSPSTPTDQTFPFSHFWAKPSFLGDIDTKNELQTESAREARKSFYCELCSKGYSRMNEFEAHEGSYDHLHKKVGEVSFLLVK